jgi:hypothetical protein
MQRARIVFLKLATGEGIEGLGEATLEWKTDAIVATLGELERFIFGKARFRSGISSIRCTGTLTGGPVRSSALPSQVSLAWLLARDVIVMPVEQDRAPPFELRRFEACAFRFRDGGDRRARTWRAHYRPGHCAGLGLARSGYFCATSSARIDWSSFTRSGLVFG